ncbi:MAG: aminotransferase class I/II-fold pyridoxal phosphate-dependent enzyme [Thermodesulfobacteriota bacterium]|nr:aminotransferase class I/II-fold pyridoxal phosphate-dependent enzyme [Thermodesulfobacteriota bacterium]
MTPLAKELNDILHAQSPQLFDMLSEVGRNLFFPKGILQQSAEAKEKAHTINATIGIAKEGSGIMHLPSVMGMLDGFAPEESITYAPSYGLPALRSAWRNEMREKNPSLAGRDISMPVVTCGITHAISVFADMWTDPGDVVLLPDMMWGNYNMILKVRHGVDIANYRLFTDDGGFNLASFEEAARKTASEKGKLIVLMNFPHNPTGYTATETEGDAIARILTAIAKEGTRVIVVCDDSYFGLFYEPDTMKESLFTKLCGAHDRLLPVKLDGATKENYVWGLRVGFITYGYPTDDPDAVFTALEKKTAGCIRGNISNASHLSQSILLKSLQDDNYQREKQEKFDILKAKAMRVKEVLADDKYADAWDVYPFNSGYFMCIRLKQVKAEALRVHLLENYGVGLIALGEHDLRVAFSCIEEADVEKLFDTIYKGAKEL